MLVEHAGHRPWVHPDAYVAPTAVLSGEAHIGADRRVLFGAVVTDDGGRVQIGDRCVVMEHDVVRGPSRHPVVIGDHVLVGPHAYVSGATVEDEVFLATGAMVFNGARMGRASRVALGGAVHIACRLEPAIRVPIGWVAVSDPAQLHPPEHVDAIPERARRRGRLPALRLRHRSGPRPT